MKVYQCLHVYPAYVKQLEERYSKIDPAELTFARMQADILADGFYQHYILTPPTKSTDEVFFILWDYRRLQRLWAAENGLPEHATLNDIRIAQIRKFNADVVFDFSPFRDEAFIHQAREELASEQISFLCWNAYIKDHAMTFPAYDAHVSLHLPYITYWKELGLQAFEMQPGVPLDWQSSIDDNRDIDILFYGQYLDNVFKNRRRLVNALLDFGTASNRAVEVHLQISPSADTSYIERNLSRVKPPIFANELYKKVRRAKIIVNNCTDFNDTHKSNARVFEALGNGALLITEAGIYPEGLIEGEDYITYQHIDELPELLSKVLSHWQHYKGIADHGLAKVHQCYGQANQWETFTAITTELKAK